MGIPQLIVIVMHTILVGAAIGRKDAEGTIAAILGCGIMQALLIWGGWYK